MDNWKIKDAFIGFKVEQSLKDQLIDAQKQKGFTSLSKFIVHICYWYLDLLTLPGGGANV